MCACDLAGLELIMEPLRLEAIILLESGILQVTEDVSQALFQFDLLNFREVQRGPVDCGDNIVGEVLVGDVRVTKRIPLGHQLAGALIAALRLNPVAFLSIPLCERQADRRHH